MIARARCPNIISFYGVSHHQGVTYMVTEFCPLVLQDEIARPVFDGKAFASISIQVGAAAAAAAAASAAGSPAALSTASAEMGRQDGPLGRVLSPASAGV